MEELESFTATIEGFDSLSLSAQIDCFAYYLSQIKSFDGIKPSDINKCFDHLDLPAYSNIPRYLRINIKKFKTRPAKYFLKKDKYYLTPLLINKISRLLGIVKTVQPTNNLFSMEIFEESRTYIQKIASQASVCYDLGLYDACNVMLRRLLETLIIETFERKGRESVIKGSDSNFLYLKDLIDVLIKDTGINISRNSKQGLKQLKNLGDLSAHNRRFLAKKADIDSKKDLIRIATEELLHIIDYKNWTN